MAITTLEDYWPCACVMRDPGGNLSSIKMNNNSVKQCRECKCRKPDEETNNNPSHPHANMERATGHEPVATQASPRFHSRVRITFTHYRERLADPDGLSIKACLDGLVHLGILQDDSASCIEEIRHRQIKSNDEKTVIEIEEVK